ncbi:DUF309 domain-containing protein [Halobaculum gomorrense]|uniref:DUF309 domain-containing protein n=1 Tax=Halobaculum gomorrense TaxID=43928 RepID=A0A1M5KAN1_9EURY|nr:DUF309 domain-containing protein [Halobaculum gomorrense]SHG49751.1 protein of unknown function [Halobaculum gomorrense]
MTTSDAPDEAARVAALRAGLALYTAGEFHAAHDPWEGVWLGLTEATAAGDAPDSAVRDEALFHGLIQFAAAQHHARTRNWPGAVGLAESGRGYLADVPDDYRGIDVAGAREALARLQADPERVEREPAPSLRHGGERVAPESLSLDAAGQAAEALAEEHDLDADAVADAARFAREEEAVGRSRFAALLFDFVRAEDAGPRGIVYDRLTGLVERERRKERDVEGLF